MKWLATTTVLCLLATPALAEKQPIKVAIEMLCYAYEDPTKPLEERYGEIPLVTGKASVKDAIAQQNVPGNVTLYLNPKTGTYSLMFDTDTKETICMLTSGDNMRPVVPGQEM